MTPNNVWHASLRFSPDPWIVPFVFRCSAFRVPVPASRVRTPVSWPAWCVARCWRGSSPWWPLWQPDTWSRATWPTTGRPSCRRRVYFIIKNLPLRLADFFLFSPAFLPPDPKSTWRKRRRQSRRRQRDECRGPGGRGRPRDEDRSPKHFSSGWDVTLRLLVRAVGRSLDISAAVFLMGELVSE